LPRADRFFVDPALREDADLAARLAAPASANAGVLSLEVCPRACSRARRFRLNAEEFEDRERVVDFRAYETFGR
jgi:hypothetical protein